jgi:hypothetical protein
MSRSLRLAGVLLVLFLTLGQGGVGQAQANTRCFAETGHCIAGTVRAFWERHSGLPVFGLPITPLREGQVEGRSYQVQWFERARFELHPRTRRPTTRCSGSSAPRRWGRKPRSHSHPRSQCRPSS